MNKPQNLIEYVPPKREAIRTFAREVCERLTARTNDQIYIQPQSIRWLAEFLELAARVQAKQLNDEQSVDSDAN